MPQVRITREAHFSAAHRVFNPEWSDERNWEVFGACANPNWHGHDYVLHVTVEAELNTDTGFVMEVLDRVQEVCHSFLVIPVTGMPVVPSCSSPAD